MSRLALALCLCLMLPGVTLAQQSQIPASAADISLSFAPVVKATAPAVVNIYASRIVQERRSPFADDPFFNQFFEALGPANPASRTRSAPA